VIRNLGAMTVAGLMTLMALTGCTTGTAVPTQGGASTPGQASGTLTKLNVAVVPSLDTNGLLEIARTKRYLADAGLELNVVPLDSGPNAITGVVAGQYDIAATAYAPPLLALGQGAPVRLVSNTGSVGADGTNGGVLVRADSGVSSWRDLAGKKVATNAPRSLLSLTVPAAVQKDGGDPSGIQIVPLPFNQIPKAVESGQVDAGAILEPFLTDGLTQYPSLKNLGDSTHAVLPEGSGAGAFVTSQATKEKKAAELARFKDAITKAMDYGNAHPDEVRAAGAPQAGLSAEQAKKLPLGTFTSKVTAQDLQPLVDLMVEHKWVTTAPDLSVFLP